MTFAFNVLYIDILYCNIRYTFLVRNFTIEASQVEEELKFKMIVQLNAVIIFKYLL